MWGAAIEALLDCGVSWLDEWDVIGNKNQRVAGIPSQGGFPSIGRFG